MDVLCRHTYSYVRALNLPPYICVSSDHFTNLTEFQHGDVWLGRVKGREVVREPRHHPFRIILTDEDTHLIGQELRPLLKQKVCRTTHWISAGDDSKATKGSAIFLTSSLRYLRRVHLVYE